MNVLNLSLGMKIKLRRKELPDTFGNRAVVTITGDIKKISTSIQILKFSILKTIDIGRTKHSQMIEFEKDMLSSIPQLDEKMSLNTYMDKYCSDETKWDRFKRKIFGGRIFNQYQFYDKTSKFSISIDIRENKCIFTIAVNGKYEGREKLMAHIIDRACKEEDVNQKTVIEQCLM